ncbi:type II toxin-antitoxin system RelE/ParE family toxin [Nocardia yamanashiensis]|uniref:type II toxin-antitoxin system RelE family toxin n=1 Tax=Nocardia yamanashiensis TaxID=209247 RepID=UPI001E43375F|nr:type II toxin-antitoxin system RelE/ParE family toxin [Nocardia yamanashiensis]UGT40942.1 type II toxin-antitoxin system RelE/ParE family toxin [Nocardia yamanashiensis]
MKYAFRFLESARRELRGLEQRDAMRLLTALTALGDDPYAEGLDIRKLAGVDAYRLRVGRFRIVYQVQDDVLVILVIKVGWRRDVYRDL